MAFIGNSLAQGLISGANIQDGTVDTPDLTASAVTTAKIADTNITTGKLADSAVTTAKIADTNITTGKLADSVVTTAKIADTNITTGKLADSAVSTAKVADNAITTIKLNSSGIAPIITGGTITGATITSSPISGSTGSFSTINASGLITSTLTSGEVMKFGSPSAGTGIIYMNMFNTSGAMYLGIEGSAGGSLWTNIPAYATGLGGRNGGGGISFSANAQTQHMLLTTTGLSVTGTLAVSGILSANNNNNGIHFSSSGGSGMHIYGGAGTHQWDIYLNSTNLRIGDNTGGGSVVINSAVTIDGAATLSTSLTVGSTTTNTIGTTGNGGGSNLRLAGFSPNATNGSYGNLLFNANSNFTGSAKRFLITNSYNVTDFAIIRSVDASTDPSLSGSGVVASGTVDFAISSSGAVTIPSTLGVTGGVTSPVGFSSTYAAASNANNLSINQSNAGGNSLDSSALFFMENRGNNPGFVQQNNGTTTARISAAGNAFFAGTLGVTGAVSAADSYQNVTAATSATLFTTSDGRVYLVTLNNSFDNYSAVYLITCADGTTAVATQLQRTNANLDVTISGLNVRIYNGISATRTIDFSYLRLK